LLKLSYLAHYSGDSWDLLLLCAVDIHKYVYTCILYETLIFMCVWL
jgi:hypothetical protein